jgi:hypothetical protein
VFVITKLAALALFVLLLWFALSTISGVIRGLADTPRRAQVAPVATPQPVRASAMPSVTRDPESCREVVDVRSGTYIDHCAKAASGPTPEELRELKRRADEAARILEPSTPEM